MQIHELTQYHKKINEDFKSFFGLNNPVVAQVWSQIGGELIQDLAARYTKDPKYANMPLAQRKKAMAADQNIQQIAQQKLEEWKNYINSVETKNRGTPLTDSQYEAAFLNWVNQSLFNGKYSSLDQAAKQNAQMIFRGFIRYRNEAEPKKTQMQLDHLKILIADETARMVQVATDLQQAQQSQQAQPTGAGTPAPGYANVTTNAPIATVPQIGNQQPVAGAKVVPTPTQAQPAPVTGTQQTRAPGYTTVKTNAPVATAPKITNTQLKPQQVKQIASNIAKAKV